MVTVEDIQLRGSYVDGGLQSGLQRLTNSVNKAVGSIDKATDALNKNSSAEKKNTGEAKKNSDAHKKAGDSAKHHSSGLLKLAAALKRILIYRAIRGLIKSVTSAITEGVKRMYEWSEAHDQVFMRVMDMYATEKQYIQDATGAAVSALLQSLLPVVVQIADAFVDLINKVQQFFRALAGESTWFKVEKVAAKFATDTNNAAKAQKALNNQLMDFDKLNLITTPKSSGKEDTETPPLDGDWVDIDPKIKKFADDVRKLIDDLKTLWGNLEKSGVFSALKNLVSESNKATWELIKTVFEKIGSVKAGSGLAKLIEGITKFSTSGISNVTKIIDKWVSDDGMFDGLMGDIGDILGDIASIANNLTDIILKITAIIGVNGSEGGSGLWLIHYILGLINGVLEGIKEMLSGNIFGGLATTLKNLVITPLLGLVRAVAQTIEFVDKAIHPNDEDVNRKWSDFYNKLDYLEGKITHTGDTAEDVMDAVAVEYDEFGHEIDKTSDNTLKKSKKYWEDQAKAAGTTYKDLTKYAKEHYGAVTTSSLQASVKEIKAANDAAKAEKDAIDKVVKASGKDYNTLATLAQLYYGKATSKTLKLTNDRINANNRFLKNQEKTETAWLKILTSMVRQGKISYGDYALYQQKLANADKKTWFSVINEIAKKWKEFAGKGKTFGADFRTGLLGELKKIENTKITMKPGQQGQWNKPTITMETKAHGGYPSMGSMFVAGEVPGQTEFVGNINGRTGVASGAEITGIAEAVYGTGETEAMLLRQLIAAVRSQNLTISPSASLGKVVNQSQRLYAGVTG